MGIEWRRAKLVLHEVCGVGDIEMPPRDFLNNTKSECESEYHMIADQEYQKALNEKLGG